jgi:hypothetical protein
MSRRLAGWRHILSTRPSFIDRTEQLEALRALTARSQPSMALLYGRRRVGKTYLLRHAFGGRRCFYFLAADTTDTVNRHDLIGELAVFLGRPLEAEDFPTWRTVFRLLASVAAEHPLVVVLDEFQYLMGGPDDAASQMAAVWDGLPDQLPLSVAVCGSTVSIMAELPGSASPLFGRLDWVHRLRAFDAIDAASMVPWLHDADAVRAYAVFGGLPRYLAAIRAGESVRNASSRTVLSPGGEVRVQVEGIVDQERGIREPRDYHAVLGAIARGRTRFNDIATGAGLADKPHAVRHVLSGLESLELVWREQNFDSPSNSTVRYRIADQAVRFWHAFVEPNRSMLETEPATAVWQQRVAPRLEAYCGLAFEAVAQQAFARRHADWGLPAAVRWGRWEGQDRFREPVEVDIVAELVTGEILAGEVKWNRQALHHRDHAALELKLRALAGSGHSWATRAVDSGRRLYVSAGGFTDEFRLLAEADGVALVSLAEIFGRGS